MNAKIRFCNRTLALICFLAATLGHSFELETGTYEIMGRYEPKTHTLIVYEGTPSEMPLRLYGEALLTGFLPGDKNHYRIKAKVHKKISDQGGRAELLGVIGVVHYRPNEMQYRKL